MEQVSGLEVVQLTVSSYNLTLGCFYYNYAPLLFQANESGFPLIVVVWKFLSKQIKILRVSDLNANIEKILRNM